MLPSGSWLNDPVPPEPFIDGRDCGDWYGMALGEPHEQPIIECGEEAVTPTANLACEGGEPAITSDPVGSSLTSADPRRDWGAEDGDSSEKLTPGDGADGAQRRDFPSVAGLSTFKLRRF